MINAFDVVDISIRFVSGGGWDSKLIKFTTRCEWSHVETIWTWRSGKQMTFGAQLRGGTKFRELDDVVYKKAVMTRIIPLNLTPEQLEGCRDWLMQQLGKPYDWPAIFAFAVGQRDWRNSKWWFCSEEIAGLLEAKLDMRLPKTLPVNRITPRDVWAFLDVAKLAVYLKRS